MELLVLLIFLAVAAAAVLVPIVRGRGAAYDPHLEAEEGAAGDARADDALEAEIAAYRAALRAGTVCEKCTAANPAGSRFCAECGAKLDASVA